MSQSDIIDLTPSGDENDDHDTDSSSSSYSVEEISQLQFYQKNCNTAEDKDYALALALSESESNHYHAKATRMPPPPRRRQRRGKNFRCGICLEDQVESWKGYTIDGCHHRFCLECLSDLIQHHFHPRWRPRRMLGIRYHVPRKRAPID